MIPTSNHPDLEDRPLRTIKNILSNLKEKCQLRIIWINFSSKKITSLENTEYEIINFQDYENAFEVLKDVKPDFILITGWLEFHNSAFALTGKILKIPVIVLFLFDIKQVESGSKSFMFKKRMRVLFKKKQVKIANKNESVESSILFNMIMEYRFFIKTIQKISTNILQKLNYIISFPIALLTKFIVPPTLVNGDLILCPFPETLNKLIEAGFDKSKISVIGDNYFDHLYSDIQSYELSKQTNSTKINILFCPAGEYESGVWPKKEEHDLIITSIKKILTNKEFEVSLKIHPFRSSKKEYEELFRRNNIKITIYQNEDLIELLQKSDVMITYSHTSIALYGIILKKSVLFLHFSDKNKTPVYYDENVSTICHSADEILTKMKESMQKKVLKKDFEKYFEKHLGGFDGKSSEKAANAILNLCS